MNFRFSPFTFVFIVIGFLLIFFGSFYLQLFGAILAFLGLVLPIFYHKRMVRTLPRKSEGAMPISEEEESEPHHSNSLASRSTHQTAQRYEITDSQANMSGRNLALIGWMLITAGRILIRMSQDVEYAPEELNQLIKNTNPMLQPAVLTLGQLREKLGLSKSVIYN